jgi:hypothetical protein
MLMLQQVCQQYETNDSVKPTARAGFFPEQLIVALMFENSCAYDTLKM